MAHIQNLLFKLFSRPVTERWRLQNAKMKRLDKKAALIANKMVCFV